MCGIAAGIGQDLPPTHELESALATLAHRGPDDSGACLDGQVWLGSRRLAIQDLTRAGHMPMQVEGLVSIVFNGEIYNYVEIRDELIAHGHRFASESDTEVLLRAYLQWGPDCLPRLNGMWAFVISDRRDGSTFIARDRFGVKPLYYAQSSGCTLFASEPKFILAVWPTTRAVNERALYELLAERRVSVARQSFYHSISVFPAGSYAIVRPGDAAVRSVPFWSYPDAADPGDSRRLEELEDDFCHLLEDSVRLRLRSDVPVGITLSGGLDSTAILSATQRIGTAGPLFAFTSVYGDHALYDEHSWARIAVAPHPSVVLDEVDAPAREWMETLGDIVWHMDGPGISPAVFPLWRIMRSARAKGIPVLLEGQGADELLGGYATHRAHALVDRATQLRQYPRMGDARLWLRMLAAANEANGLRRTSIDALTVASPRFARVRARRIGARGALSDDFAMDASLESPEPEVRAPTDRLRTRLQGDFASDTLPGFLHYGDAISMAHGIESRLPFLDYRLVEFCIRLPAALRGGGDRSKEILRKYLRRVGQPTIASRVDKRGFPTPTGAWLAANGGREARDLLLSADTRIAGYVDRHAVAHLIDRQVAGHHAASDQLYALTTTEIWLRTCVGSTH